MVLGNAACLPRTRGDRPDASARRFVAHWSPPHPRGSTLDEGSERRSQRVSPAPAGIDRGVRCSGASKRSLPRTRGDRPVSYTSLSATDASPPHPRGSTPANTSGKSAFSVSPAPAGIDLSTWRKALRPPRLPRTRGDRPVLVSVFGGIGASPPHPRGSTSAAPSGAKRPPVSPAPAGIDPPVSSRTAPESSSPPHPRGSTLGQVRIDLPAHVSPAPAGIDLTLSADALAQARLPRTRGDRPGRPARRAWQLRSPPHPRGSTLAGAAVDQLLGVSPAPAGIDPQLAAFAVRKAGLPRTRGDRP